MKKTSLPRLLLWSAIIGFSFLLFMTLMRFVFFYSFHPPGTSIYNYLGPLRMGLSYDLRIVCGAILFPYLIGSLSLKRRTGGGFTLASIIKISITVLLMAGLLFFMWKGHMQAGTLYFFTILFLLILLWLFYSKNCNPFDNRVSKNIIKGWFIFVSAVLIILYGADLAHYDYLKQRLSAGVFDYGVEVSISLNMIWESYPVFSFLLYFIGFLLAFILLMNYSYRKISALTYKGTNSGKFFLGLTFTILSAVGIFGRINQYPLRWSDAFDFRDDFKANLALNPIQSFLSTLQFRHSGYDPDLVKEYYPLMADFLNVEKPDSSLLTYTRNFVPEPGAPKRNVVIVICESFSMYKSSMSGNKLNTTPFFNEISQSGIFFNHCFTPSYGTARGIWATLTGIPDISYPNTSSRNPSFVDQHSIMNDYRDYSKFYFIGGSSSWANIRGLLSNNLADLRLYEEENFDAKKVDVWGISDKRLLLAANDTLAKQTKPFIAIIQTADNHRPYTIPEEDKKEFKLVSYPKDTLFKYGFGGNAELNAFRYFDFVIQKFITAAKNEPYFKNTIFAFVGDHGINGNMTGEYPKEWEEAGLGIHHVPLLFYAPDILVPQMNSRICSQVDLLPTVSAFAGVPYTNTTLGINLFNNRHEKSPMGDVAFIFDPTIQEIGVVTDSFIYNKSLLSTKEKILPFLGTGKPTDVEVNEMRNFTMAWYETAKYLLSHNQKDRIPDNK